MDAKRIIATSSKDKVLPISVRCLKVVFLKSLWKDDSSDIYFCLSSFYGSPAMKSKVCSLLEWCFSISVDTHWYWFQRTYVIITTMKNL